MSEPRGQGACLSHLLRSVPPVRSCLLTRSAPNYQLHGNGAMWRRETKPTTKGRPSAQVPGSRRQGKGPLDLLGKPAALGREERERFQDWGLSFLCARPGRGGRKGKPGEPGNGTRCPHNPHTLGQGHSKLPRWARSPQRLGHPLVRPKRARDGEAPWELAKSLNLTQ